MTAAQRNYLLDHGIDPWTLIWRDALDLGVPGWGATEAAQLPDGRILVANGTVHRAVDSQSVPE